MKRRRAPLLLFLALPIALGWGCFGGREDGASSDADGASGSSNASCLDANVVDKSECGSDELGLSCNSGAQCCRCVSLPPCGDQWTCVDPAELAQGCPATPPASDGSCDVEALSCEYCTDEGPLVMTCHALRGIDPVELAWGPGQLGACEE